MHIKNFIFNHVLPPSYWVFAGVAYGYPRCCIEHFMERIAEEPEDPWGELEGWFMGTGYIACPECRKLPEAEIRAAIDSHRSVEVPFPGSNVGDACLSKIVKRFMKHGFPKNYSSLDFYIKENERDVAQGKRYQNRRAAETRHMVESYPAVVNEFFIRNKRRLAGCGINRTSGVEVELTNNPITASGFVAFLGKFRGKYHWGLCNGGKITGEASEIYGFTPPYGVTIVTTKETVQTLCFELYESGWNEEKREYNYDFINDELERVIFRTKDLSFPFKIRIGGEWDLNCGPELIREAVLTAVNEDYDLSDEDDLDGPELAPYTVNFYHPKFGWQDLRKFRLFCSENDYLPQHLKEEYFFYVYQTWVFERFVELKISEAKKLGLSEEKIALLQEFTGVKLGNRAILAGNYVQLVYEGNYVLIKDRAFLSKLWCDFHEVCGELRVFFFLMFDINGDVLADNRQRPFKQRGVVDVDELVNNIKHPTSEELKEVFERVKVRNDKLAEAGNKFTTELVFDDRFQGGQDVAPSFPTIELGAVRPVVAEIIDTTRPRSELDAAIAGQWNLHVEAGDLLKDAVGDSENNIQAIQEDADQADDLGYALGNDDVKRDFVVDRDVEFMYPIKHELLDVSKLEIKKGREGGGDYTLQNIQTIINEEALDTAFGLVDADEFAMTIATAGNDSDVVSIDCSKLSTKGFGDPIN